MCIMDSYVGWPGSTHDASVLRNSPLFEAMEDNCLIHRDTFIIGKRALVCIGD